MSETIDLNGTDPKIPLSVLDRVIKLSQENSTGYSAMVAAVDAISARSAELSDAVDRLSSDLEDETLTTTIKVATLSLRQDVELVKNALTVYTVPKYNMLTAVSNRLEYENTCEQDVKHLAKAVLWFLTLISIFQKNKTLFAFVAGAIAISLLGMTGTTVMDIFKFFIK
jgi:hypothetical protein